MDKTITTALLIVVSMILVVALFNVAYPAIIQGGDAVTSMANNIAERMKEDISFIHASSERDSANGWLDPNGNALFDVYGWVKNVGTTRIIALDRIDVFFGPEGNFVRIPSQADANGSYPYWTSQVENGADWSPTATLQIAIHYQTPLSAGRYYMKVSLPNGVSADYFLGI
jgi:hypothetical protein